MDMYIKSDVHFNYLKFCQSYLRNAVILKFNLKIKLILKLIF